MAHAFSRCGAGIASLLACLSLSGSLLAQGTVDPRTGALDLAATDVSVAAGPAILEFRRAYRGVLTGVADAGPLGRGWRSEWERRLDVVGATAFISGTNGTRVLQRLPDGGAYGAPDGGRLELDAAGTARYRAADGSEEHFDVRGRLVAVRFRQSAAALRFDYDTADRLAGVGGPSGELLALRYDGSGRLVRVEDRDGNGVAYRYVGERLVQALRDGAPGTLYDYDGAGRLIRVREPPTVDVTFTYDAENRIVSRRRSDGGEDRFVYGAAEHESLLQDGTRIHHRWSGEATVRTVTAPSGARSTMHYRADGLPLLVVDALGRRTDYAYDDLGRVRSVVEPGNRSTRHDYVGASTLPLGTTYWDGDAERYRYDANGRLAAVDRNGEEQRRVEYDAEGRLSRVVGPGSTDRRFEYGDDGRIVAEKDGLGRTTRYRYDDRGRLAEWIGPDQAATRYQYDAQGHLAEEMLSGGRSVQYRYDAYGRLVQRTLPDGSRYEYGYDGHDHLAVETDPLGRVTRIAYDASGRPVEAIAPGGARTVDRYDVDGRLASRTNSLGGRSDFVHDAFGRLVREGAPDGSIREHAYDERDRLIETHAPEGRHAYRYGPDDRLAEEEAPGGAVTRYAYDARGRLARLDGADGLALEYRYEANGLLASVADNRGARRAYRYDAAGQVIEERQEGGRLLQYTYDAGGRIVGIRDSAGPRVAIAHDEQGRVAEVRANERIVGRYRYDPMGRPVELADALGAVRELEYDAAGQLRAVRDASGDRAEYRYDAAGMLAQIVQPSGVVTRRAYDAMGNVVAIDDPTQGKSSHEYDTAGRLVASTAPDGAVARYGYDRAGRLAEIRGSAGPVLTFRYDDAGNPMETSDGTFVVRYGYDAAGRPVSIEYPLLGRVLGYEYDASGRTSAFTASDGHRIGYDYDADGRLAEIVVGSEGSLRFAYDGAGRATELRYPNGVTGRWRYDADGTVAAIEYAGRDKALLFAQQYRHDAAGNLVERGDATGRVRYAHDAGGRLAREQAAGRDTRYRYRQGGDREARTDADATTRYAYDASGRIAEAGAVRFEHDAAGRMTARIGPSGRIRYRWDALGNLVAVEPQEGEVVRFAYAPNGLRVRRDAGGDTTWYVHDLDGNLVAELDAAFRSRATYVHGPELDQPLHARVGEKTFYLHADGLGNVVLVTDADGRPVARNAYDAFGRLAGSPSTDALPMRFAGAYLDAAVGLYYLRSRWYDPDLGRFLSADTFPADPRRPDTLNRYVYVRNAPTRYRDPTGAMEMQRGFSAAEARELYRLRARIEFEHGGSRFYDVGGINQQVEDAMWLQRGRAPGEGFRILRDQYRSELANIQDCKVAQRVIGRGEPTQFIKDLVNEPGRGLREVTRYPNRGRGPEPWIEGRKGGGWKTVRSLERPEPMSRTQFERNWELQRQALELQNQQARAPTSRSAAVSDAPPQRPGSATARQGVPDPARGATPGATVPPGRPGPSATNVAGGMAAALGVTAMYASYHSCLEVTGDPERCNRELLSQVRQGIAMGVITTAGAAALVALVPAAGPLLVGAGLLVAGYGASDALDAWANAPATRAEAGTAAMQRELIVRIDELYAEVERAALDLGGIAGTATSACASARALLAEAEGLGARCDALWNAIKGRAATIQQGFAQCEQARAAAAALAALAGQVAANEQRVVQGVALAKAKAQTCASAADADMIDELCTATRGLAAGLNQQAEQAASMLAKLDALASTSATAAAALAELDGHRAAIGSADDRLRAIALALPGEARRATEQTQAFKARQAQLMGSVSRVRDLLPQAPSSPSWAPLLANARDKVSGMSRWVRAPMAPPAGCDALDPQAATTHKLTGESRLASATAEVARLRGLASTCENLPSGNDLALGIRASTDYALLAVVETEGLRERAARCRDRLAAGTGAAAITGGGSCARDEECPLGAVCSADGVCIAGSASSGTVPGPRDGTDSRTGSTTAECRAHGDCREGYACIDGKCVKSASPAEIAAGFDREGSRPGGTGSGTVVAGGSGPPGRFGTGTLTGDMADREAGLPAGAGPGSGHSGRPGVGTGSGTPMAPAPGTGVGAGSGAGTGGAAQAPQTAQQKRWYGIETTVVYDWQGRNCTMIDAFEGESTPSGLAALTNQAQGKALGPIRGAGGRTVRSVTSRVYAGPSATKPAYPGKTGVQCKDPGATGPSAPQSQDRARDYLLEAVVGYEKTDIATGIGPRSVSCTLTGHMVYTIRPSEVQASLRQWGQGTLDVVRSTSGTRNGRLVSTRVVSGPADHIAQPNPQHRIACGR